MEAERLMLIALTRLLLAAALLLLFLEGCGSDTPTLTSVHGTVYYRNLPMTGGTIVFTPDASRGNSGPLARGEIAPDGTYFLRTGDALGCASGCHRVTIIGLETADSNEQPFAASRSLVPAKYRDPELSGLTCEVAGERANSIDFRLE